ncbi:MAG TPA: two-component regulator propeller domain-containing protein [Bacteroidales bacterium]|nr:two-component regulator propeller domain-containing protein [Bacteroidales bacterium]
MKIISIPFAERITRKILVLLFLSLFCLAARTQTLFFEKFGVEEGLGSSKVYTVIQDRHDFVWLGTESGAARFDGNRFVNFGSLNGLSAGGVKSLFEDTTGRIWFGHLNGGISWYDGIKFSRARIDTLTITGDITGISQLGNDFWITTSSNGAFRTQLPPQGATVLKGRHYTGQEGLSDQIFSLYIDRNNNLFCITDAFIKKYNPEKDIFETYSPPGLTTYFNVVSMFQDTKGNYWYGLHNGGLYMQDAVAGEMKIYDILNGLSRMFVSCFAEDYKGNVWIGTFGGGVTLYSEGKLKIYNRSNGLNSLNILNIFEDREKNILISDYYNGLSIFKGDHFVTYNTEDILPDRNVWAISRDNAGRYWFGTNNGISVYDPAAKQGSRVKIYNEATRLIGNNVRFIIPGGDGTMWVGTKGFGVYRYEMKTEKFNADPEINAMLPVDRVVTALSADHRKRIWIGTNDGLAVWDPAAREGSVYTQGKGLAGNMIKSVLCDSKGTVWAGSEMRSGLSKLTPGSDNFTIVNIGEGVVPQSLEESPDGTIWIGTVSGLLALKNDSVMFTLTENDGLLSGNIKSLLSDRGRYLYIGTNLGLNRYDTETGVISSFTKYSGFTGIEALQNAAFRESDGKLWFGTANGATMLDPAKLPPVTESPKVYITGMEVNNQPREMKAGMKLSYREKSINFHYYSISLTDPKSVRYKVMLKGADSDWRPVTDQTVAFWSGLSPGHYTLMVKAVNSSGVWSEKAVEFPFVIKPPFYLSPWFIITMTLLIITGVIVYIKVRERNLIREKRILEAKVAERTAELVQKNIIIEEKNRDITASIRYAERIQRAMLPRDDTFEETFVLFLPKDIVSGDFYWMYDNGDVKLLAAVDCTGHGVPGAFMSIIGHNSLNKVVREYGLIRPSAILDQLNIEVIRSIIQSQEKGIQDGMDLSLIAFNRQKFTLEFAGAYNPLYLVRNGEVIVHKADRFPIGMATLEQKKSFSNVEVPIRPGDMIYMCSDGYADQFGSPEGKKYKVGNIKKIISEIYNLPVNEQKQILEKEIMDWKGDLPQVDDILFIGMRLLP